MKSSLKKSEKPGKHVVEPKAPVTKESSGDKKFDAAIDLLFKKSAGLNPNK